MSPNLQLPARPVPRRPAAAAASPAGTAGTAQGRRPPAQQARPSGPAAPCRTTPKPPRAPFLQQARQRWALPKAPLAAPWRSQRCRQSTPSCLATVRIGLLSMRSPAGAAAPCPQAGAVGQPLPWEGQRESRLPCQLASLAAPVAAAQQRPRTRAHQQRQQQQRWRQQRWRQEEGSACQPLRAPRVAASQGARRSAERPRGLPASAAVAHRQSWLKAAMAALREDCDDSQAPAHQDRASERAALPQAASCSRGCRSLNSLSCPSCNHRMHHEHVIATAIF